MSMNAKTVAIVLAGGRGSRMNSEVHKQYMELGGKPLLFYSLKAFQDSPVDEIILVTGAGEEQYCRTHILVPYGLTKVKQIVRGGKERYHSVYEGLKAAADSAVVLIHDGARPFVTVDLIKKSIDGAKRYQACVIAVKSKDTVKLGDADGFVKETPEREYVWSIQTPQSFSYRLIMDAYERLFMEEAQMPGITDDGMVAERMLGCRIKLIEGDYRNMKVTGPEDMIIAEGFLNDI